MELATPLRHGIRRLVDGQGQGQSRAGSGERAKLGEERLKGIRTEVDGHTLAEEQGGCVGIEPALGQRCDHASRLEVATHVGDGIVGEPEPADAGPFVGLRVGMVHLPPPHARLRVAKGPSVVARAERHHLSHVPFEGVDHHPVKKRRAAA